MLSERNWQSSCANWSTGLTCLHITKRPSCFERYRSNGQLDLYNKVNVNSKYANRKPTCDIIFDGILVMFAISATFYRYSQSKCARSLPWPLECSKVNINMPPERPNVTFHLLAIAIFPICHRLRDIHSRNLTLSMFIGVCLSICAFLEVWLR